MKRLIPVLIALVALIVFALTRAAPPPPIYPGVVPYEQLDVRNFELADYPVLRMMPFMARGAPPYLPVDTWSFAVDTNWWRLYGFNPLDNTWHAVNTNLPSLWAWNTYLMYSTVTNLITYNLSIVQGGVTNTVGAMNPTDNYVPYRLNATNFADSYLYHVATGTGTDTNLYFGPGTTNVLYRNTRDIVYTNGGTSAYLDVRAGTGESASFGNLSGQVSILAAMGKPIYLSPNAGVDGDVIIDSVSLRPDVENKSLGYNASNGAFTNAWIKGGTHIIGTNDGLGNYSWLDIYQTDTNSPVVFDIQTLGTAINGANQGFSFRTNGVEILSLTGPGGGGILSQLLWTNAPTGTGTADAGSSNTIASLPTGLRNATLINAADIFDVGQDTGLNSILNQATNVYNVGLLSGSGMTATNAWFILNLGDSAGASSVIADSTDLFNIGLAAGDSSVTTNVSAFALNLGDYAGESQSLDAVIDSINIGYDAGAFQEASNSTFIMNIGDVAGEYATHDASYDVINLGFSSGSYMDAVNSTNLLNVGSGAGSAAEYDTVNDAYNYGLAAGSGLVTQISDSERLFNYGAYAGYTVHGSALTNWFTFGNGPARDSSMTNLNDFYAYGSGAFANSVLTDSAHLYAWGSDAATNMSGSGYTNTYMLGSGSKPTRKTNEFVFGDTNYLYTFPGTTGIVARLLTIHNTNAFSGLDNVGLLESHDYGGSAPNNNIVLRALTNNPLANSPNIRLQVDSTNNHIGLNIGGTTYSAQTCELTATGDGRMTLRSAAGQVGVAVPQLSLHQDNSNAYLTNDGTLYLKPKSLIRYQPNQGTGWFTFDQPTSSTAPAISFWNSLAGGTSAVIWNTDGTLEMGPGVTARDVGFRRTQASEFTITDATLTGLGNLKAKYGLFKSVQGGYTNVLVSATGKDFLYVSVPNTNGIGGHVVYTVFCTDGTDVQEISGDVKFAAVAKGTAVTATTADVQTAAAVTGGSTLTAALAANTATNNVFALGVTATTSLTTTNLLIKWRVETPSTFTVNAIP